MSRVETGWLPTLELPPPARLTWTGSLRFRAYEDRWGDGSWFHPLSIQIVIEVGTDDVVVRWGDLNGSVSRDELRVWFSHGTADLAAGDVSWRARPMGIALSIDGWGTAPVPNDVAVQLAAHL